MLCFGCLAGASKIWISSTRKSNFQKILPHKISVIEKDFHRCGQACLKNSKCCSYEFSPTYKQCNLNKECLPTTKKFQDFLFCKKNPPSAGMNRLQCTHGVEGGTVGIHRRPRSLGACCSGGRPTACCLQAANLCCMFKANPN